MQQKITKTKEAIEAEQREIERLREEVKAMCNRVPQGVLAGSYQTAVAWKKSASDAYRLATSKAPTLAKLLDAKDAMQIAARAG